MGPLSVDSWRHRDCRLGRGGESIQRLVYSQSGSGSDKGSRKDSVTIQRPERHWIERELIRVLEALFVGAIGFMASQFLAIPSQQVHQDDRLNAIEKH